MNSSPFTITVTVSDDPAPLHLHHYTSGNGLLGILSDDAIWATSIHHLNDSREFTYARNLAIAEVKALEKTDDEKLKLLCPAVVTYLEGIFRLAVYVACFSEVGDSLSQWRGYCPPGFGYCLAFIPERLEEIALSQGFQLYQCVYDRGQQIATVKKWVNDTLNRLVDSYNDKGEKSLVVFVQDTCRPFLNDFVSFGARFKDPSFSDEREWRLVAVVPSNDPRVQLMAGKSMLVPYVPVNLQIGEGDRVLNLVRVGPTPHLELASDSLTRIFTRVRLGNVTHSAIPYRDW